MAWTCPEAVRWMRFSPSGLLLATTSQEVAETAGGWVASEGMVRPGVASRSPPTVRWAGSSGGDSGRCGASITGVATCGHANGAGCPPRRRPRSGNLPGNPRVQTASARGSPGKSRDLANEGEAGIVMSAEAATTENAFKVPLNHAISGRLSGRRSRREPIASIGELTEYGGPVSLRP